MTVPSYDSCATRVTVDDVLACCRRVAERGEAAKATVEAAIKEALWLFDRATDYTFRGRCASVVRPCVEPDPCGRRWTVLEAAAAFGHPFAWPSTCGCGLSAARCSCSFPTIRLPYVPVHEVVRVVIDGVELPATSYQLIPGTNLLRRVDGEGWPTHQNLAVDLDDPEAWGVEFVHGWDLPPGAKRRIAGFACEIAKACNNDPCSLGERFRVTKTEAGEFLIHDDFRQEGLTGDEPLDNWIATWRGGRARTRPRLTRPRDTRRKA